MTPGDVVLPWWRRWGRGAAVVLPVWLHIAWLIWAVGPLAVFASENVFGLLNALWFIPIGLALYGAARAWVAEWVVWTFMVLPYGAILLWAGIGAGD